MVLFLLPWILLTNVVPTTQLQGHRFLKDEIGNEADNTSKITWANLSADEYSSSLPKKIGVGFFYDSVDDFINSIFPSENAVAITTSSYDSFLKNGDSNILSPIIQPLAIYLTCALLGLLYIIIFPMVACCVCHLRLRAQCGGRRHQSLKDAQNGTRRTVLFACTSVSFGFMLIGGIATLINNENMYDVINNFSNVTRHNLRDLKTFFKNTLQQTEQLQDKNFQFLMKVMETDLKIVKEQVGLQDDNQTISLRPQTENNTYDIDQMRSELLRVHEELLDKCQRETHEDHDDNTTSVVQEVTANNESRDIREDHCLQHVRDDINLTIEILVDDIKPLVNNVDRFYKIIKMFESIISGIPEDDVYSHINVWSFYLEILSKYVIRCLGYLVLVITCLGVSGIVLGLRGTDLHVLPTERGRMSNCGSILLTTSAVIMFVFGAVFMLPTVALFIIGVPLRGVLCQTIYILEDLEQVMQPYGNSINEFIGENITVTGVLRDCRAGDTAYVALKFIDLANTAEGHVNQTFVEAQQNIQQTVYMHTVLRIIPYKVPEKIQELQTHVIHLHDMVLSFKNFTLESLLHGMSPCTPLWNVYDFLLVNTVCLNLINTINGCWFALGWCVFFFAPSIVFSMKLAKYFRRTSDSFLRSVKMSSRPPPVLRNQKDDTSASEPKETMPPPSVFPSPPSQAFMFADESVEDKKTDSQPLTSFVAEDVDEPKKETADLDDIKDAGDEIGADIDNVKNENSGPAAVVVDDMRRINIVLGDGENVIVGDVDETEELHAYV